MLNTQDIMNGIACFDLNIRTDTIICLTEATEDNGGNWCLRKTHNEYFYKQSYEDSPFIDECLCNSNNYITQLWGTELLYIIQQYVPSLKQQLFEDTSQDVYPNVYYIIKQD